MKRSATVASSLCLIVALLLAPALCQAQGSLPSISSVVSASAFGQFTSIAPGSWIEIYGSDLAADSRSWAGTDFSGINAPTSLDGTKVTIGGQSAFIDYISPGQVNAQVPSGVGTGSQPIVLATASGASSPYMTTVMATQPGLLAPASFSIGGTQYATALFSDGATYALPPYVLPGLAVRRAKPGDTITLYGIGFGSVVPSVPAGQVVQESNTLASSLQIYFGTALAQLTYDGLAPGAVGLYQFNVVVPSVPSSDTVPLTFTLGGVAGTQTLDIAVENGTPPPFVITKTMQPVSIQQNGPAASMTIYWAGNPTFPVTINSAPASCNPPQTTCSSGNLLVSIEQNPVVYPNFWGCSGSIQSSYPLDYYWSLTDALGVSTPQSRVEVTCIPIQVQTVSLSNTSVASGGSVQGTVTLSAAAPGGGILVALSSSSAAASVPANVMVPAGATSATFKVSTATISLNQTVTITASYSGSTAETLLTITGPFVITSTMQPVSVRQNGPAASMTIYWSGNPAFPVTINYAPASCNPELTCASGNLVVSTQQNPIVAPNVWSCYGSVQSSWELDYYWWLTDAHGVSTPQTRVDVLCVAP